MEIKRSHWRLSRANEACLCVLFCAGKLVEHGDWVSVRFVCQGTHTGPGLGFEPPGNHVQFSAIALDHIENGQWVEGWIVVDFFALQKQANGEMRISRVE